MDLIVLLVTLYSYIYYNKINIFLKIIFINFFVIINIKRDLVRVKERDSVERGIIKLGETRVSGREIEWKWKKERVDVVRGKDWWEGREKKKKVKICKKSKIIESKICVIS